MTKPECFTIKMNSLNVTDLQNTAKLKPLDIAYICPKSYNTIWHTKLISDYLAGDGFCISLQNSFNEKLIASEPTGRMHSEYDGNGIKTAWACNSKCYFGYRRTYNISD